MRPKIVQTASALLKFRRGGYADFCVLAQRTEQEYGWGASDYDYHIWNRFLGPDWFWVADNERDKTIAYFSAAQRNSEYGHVGNLYVREDFRDGGVAHVLMEKAVELLRGNLGLVAAPKAKNLYEENGFTKVPDFTVGIAKGSISRSILKDKISIDNVSLKKLDSDILKPLIHFDAQLWSRDRSDWCTECLLNHPHSKTLVAIDESTKSVSGYGSAKVVYGQRIRIGPVYANSTEIAKLITSSLLKDHEDDLNKYEVELWNLQLKDEKSPVIGAVGLESDLLGQHMFTREIPRIAKDKIFVLADTDISLG